MKKKSRQLFLKKFVEQLDISPGDNLLVSSSILDLLIKFKKNKEDFNPNMIIDCLIKKIGSNGNLLFPTYNWDYCKGYAFDYFKTVSRAGSLSNFALERKDFDRSRNPIYSFAVYGKNKDEICNLKHQSCFGLNSPFGFLIKNNGKNLFIGLDYKDGFTFAHLAEEKVGVSYRYFKTFKGNYFDKLNRKKNLNFKMYVRKLELNIMTGIDKKLDDILLGIGGLEKKKFNGINFNIVDIRKAYEVMVSDLINKRGIIYKKKI